MPRPKLLDPPTHRVDFSDNAVCIPREMSGLDANLVDGSLSVTGTTAAQGVRRFIEGDDLYAAMLADIRAAQASVRLETYIYSADSNTWVCQIG